MGVAVQMTAKQRPTAHVVVLEGSWASPSVVEAFDLTSVDEDKPTQLTRLAAGLRSRAKGLEPDRVVIRRADYFKVASSAEGPRMRLLAEGAMAAAAKEVVDDVLLLTGKDTATFSQAASKADLEAHAGAVLPGLHVEAAGAALAGLT
jgi:hypothetical protein